MDRQQQIRDFLEAKVKEKGLSLNSLSLQLGKNATYLFHYIKRNSPRRLDEKSRRLLAKILEIEEQDLCDIQLSKNAHNSFGSSNFTYEIDENMVSIDVIDMDGEYKGRFDSIKNNIIGKELMPLEVFKTYTSSLPEDVKIIQTIGDAMSPTINSKDLIWVDTSHKLPMSDGIYIINTAGDMLIRRIQVNPFDNSFEVSADNSSYKSFNVTDCKKLNICGKVILVTRKL